MLQRDDDDLVRTAVADLRTVLGPDLPDPVDAHVQRWGGALPQYAVGHVDPHTGRPGGGRPPAGAGAGRGRVRGRGHTGVHRVGPSRSPRGARRPCASHNEGMSDHPTRKPAPSVVREINDSIRYAMWSVFASVQPLGEDREKVAAEAAALLTDVEAEGVVVRGVYDVAGPARRRRPHDLVARRDHRAAAVRLPPVPAHRARRGPGAGLVRRRAAPAGRVQQEPRPGVPRGRGPAGVHLRLPVRAVLRLVPLDDARAPRHARGARPAGPRATPTSAPTPSRRSPWATTSGSSRSRPTSCTASSTSCATCGPRRRGGTSARRSPSTPAPGCRSRTSSRTCADHPTKFSASLRYFAGPPITARAELLPVEPLGASPAAWAPGGG